MKNFLKKAIALLCCLCITAALVPSAMAASAKKVLFIGSDCTNDTVYYLSDLAHLTGQDLEVALVEQKDADLRVMSAIAYQNAKLTYYKANASTGYKLKPAGSISVFDALKEQKWDMVVLQNGLMQSAIKGTYCSDLKYLTDAVKDLVPKAKLYWNMTWALEKDCNVSEFKTYFAQNEIAMYNNLLFCTKDYIASNQAFDGIIYVGTAIENARATALGEKMLRNARNLSGKQGRLIAALTALQTLCPNANPGRVTVSALDGILTDDGTSPDTYVNNDANLALVKSAVKAACSGEPKALPYEDPIPSNETEGIITVAKASLPQYLKFPDITVLDNGDVIVSAYENIVHTPGLYDAYERTYPNLPGTRIEGVGSLVFFKSTDNGKTFEKLPFVVDESQMEAWGLCSLSNRYQKLKENPNIGFIYYFDPRDPNVKSVHCDVNGDGKKENILLLTFWVRSFTKTENTSSGITYLTYSTDGGKTWATPQGFNIGVKRGDITEFSDGTLLVPTYSTPYANFSEVTFDPGGKIKLKQISNIKDELWDSESSDGMETSVISPDGGDTVFAYIRNSGAVMRSDDRGHTWTFIANQKGGMNQPGFTRIDANRVFVTWSTPVQPRETYGKVFYTDGAWNDSGEKLVYGYPQSTNAYRDTGDPSCATLKDGKIITVTYDAYYHAILATIEDPDDPVYARTSVSPAYQEIAQSGTAFASKQTVFLNGRETTFDMYMLVDERGGETNFIKLRDLAYLLSGTKAKFEVGFNAKNNTITLKSNKPYTANGSEMSTPFSGSRAFRVCNSKIKVNGEIPALQGITLTDDQGGEYNYFKLRDLGAALGFKVNWSDGLGITVDTEA